VCAWFLNDLALGISFALYTAKGRTFFRLLVIFSAVGDKPEYGKNPGLVQGFAARPEDIELAGGTLLPVPRAIPHQVDGLGLVGLCDEP
jgi:hypothetical protein